MVRPFSGIGKPDLTSVGNASHVNHAVICCRTDSLINRGLVSYTRIWIYRFRRNTKRLYKAYLIHEIFALALDGRTMRKKLPASPMTIYILLTYDFFRFVS